MFFFSSRRRHTISKRDWSSDVCSSDLTTNGESTIGTANQSFIDPVDNGNMNLFRVRSAATHYTLNKAGAGTLDRSEERRVGKECRPRRAAHQRKKQDNESQTCHYCDRR